MTPDGPPRRTYGSAGGLVPPDWQLQPPDPNWKGKRFLSPDGAAWFAAYATPVGEEPVAAQMKIFAFVEGEETSYLRGGRNWIAVAGLKGDRMFYRKAALACSGKSWHHIAFEYPPNTRCGMEVFVNRASEMVDQSENVGCDAVVSSQ